MTHIERNQKALNETSIHEPRKSERYEVTLTSITNNREEYRVIATGLCPERPDWKITGTLVVYVDGHGSWDGWDWDGTPDAAGIDRWRPRNGARKDENELQAIIDCVQEHRGIYIEESSEDGR